MSVLLGIDLLIACSSKFALLPSVCCRHISHSGPSMAEASEACGGLHRFCEEQAPLLQLSQVETA